MKKCWSVTKAEYQLRPYSLTPLNSPAQGRAGADPRPGPAPGAASAHPPPRSGDKPPASPEECEESQLHKTRQLELH